MTLTREDVFNIKEFHKAGMEKLTKAMEGTTSMVPGPMTNDQAPCLIPSAIYDFTKVLNIINESE